MKGIMKMMKLCEKNGNIIDVKIKIGYYARNKTNIKISLICYDKDNVAEDYGNLTVNLGDTLPPCHAYIDINGIPSLPMFIKKYKLAEDTGYVKTSGFVEYPMYRFNMDKLQEYE